MAKSTGIGHAERINNLLNIEGNGYPINLTIRGDIYNLEFFPDDLDFYADASRLIKAGEALENVKSADGLLEAVENVNAAINESFDGVFGEGISDKIFDKTKYRGLRTRTYVAIIRELRKGMEDYEAKQKAEMEKERSKQEESAKAGVRSFIESK